ncbi:MULTISPECIES: hypothetical protein [Pseudomonas]|uniref:hypothetical protein n=1 Tax=Pseudomonas TaxID=286 RepID=UPI001E5C6F08|nr:MULTISPECIES: hypothetical protein [Pseudomonas]MCE1115770.1 hypothetical protein [Pseudomonas sp. NMI795_08]
MLTSVTGMPWQPAVQPSSRTGNEQALAQALPFQPITVADGAAAQQNSQGSTSQQNSEDNRKEAFAKLMVMLQNPDVAARQQSSVGKQEQSNAMQEFRDYMDKSPAEKIKEKYLQELGLSEDEYNALPPEKKARIDEQIAQRMQEDVESKALASLGQQALGTQESEALKGTGL